MRDFRFVIVVLLVLLLFFSTSISIFYTDWLWFKDLYLESVFWYRIFAKSGIFIISFVFVFALAFLNILPTLKKGPYARVIPLGSEAFWIRYRDIFQRFFKLIALTAVVIIAVIQAASAATSWETVVLFINRTSTGVRVPIFNNDASFFLFEFSFYSKLLDWFLTTLLLVFALVSGGYFLRSVAGTLQSFRLTFSWYKEHFYVLLSLISFTEAARLYLGLYRRAYSALGAIYGPSYTDIHAVMPALRISAILFVILGIYFVYAALRGMLWSGPIAVAAIIIGFSLVSIYLYPSFYQAYVVSPNELSRERPFIKYHIDLTEYAYDLGRFSEISYPPASVITRDTIEKNRSTIENIRLWDWRPLLSTYNQLQTIRTYYTFTDIDLDRYIVENRLRQVALAARELSHENLPERAKTWINLHLKYTHGYGLAVSPVNEITDEGLPVFYLKDIPGEPAYDVFKLKKPQIYFGELTNSYAIVNTKEKEFDYPAGDKNVYTVYRGKAGIRLDSRLKKLAFAVRFGTLKIILSSEITPKSRMIFDRSIVDRAKKIAPFLLYDRDPYPVVVKGKIFWILDAYSHSSYFPYSQPYENEKFNYIRNSVKVVVDAYEGTTDFYIWDEKDPIVRTYQRAFPKIFKSKELIPEEIEKHLRYPEDYFLTQAKMLAVYHIKQPDVFYNREDQWEIAKEVYDVGQQEVQPYYVIMQLRDAPYQFEKPEFLLMLPFTPRGKNNMVAWVFVSSDVPNYGKGAVYTFLKGKLVYGSLQIESRINQDPYISQQITLWNQAGSRVIRGNLLVIPINGAILYVEPLYLQSEQSQIPELKRVVLATEDKVIMNDNIEKSLSQIMGEKAPDEEEAKPAPRGEKTIQSLKELFLELEGALKKGEFDIFGKKLKEIREMLFGRETTSGPQ